MNSERKKKKITPKRKGQAKKARRKIVFLPAGRQV
jgi:ribosomal protein L23